MEPFRKLALQMELALPKVDNIYYSHDLKDLYFILDVLVTAGKKLYPYIPCKAGCSSCCSNYGNPMITPREWFIIYNYLLKQVDKETLKLIIEQNITLFKDKIELLIQNYLAYMKALLNNEIYNETKIKPFTCPFLINNLCSIYQVRPAICRVYGYFSVLLIKENKKLIYFCDINFSNNKLRKIFLPVWNPFLHKLIELSKPYILQASIPLWLFSHYKDKETLLPFNPNPNFVNIMNKKFI